MKLRTDFVSNSSSSSFIVATKEPQSKLVDFLVKNAHSSDPKRTKYWSTYFDEENRDFLNAHFSTPYIQLVIGNFNIFGETPETYWMEESEENAATYKDFSQTVVEPEDINKFVKDGQVKITFDDLRKGNCPRIHYSSYKVYEITQDTIDFTHWLISKCDSKDNENWKALNDFYHNELPEKVKLGDEEITEEMRSKWDKLIFACNKLMLEPEYEVRIKVSEDEWKRELHPLSELLDKYEKLLKEGHKIRRFCAGNSGEGTDWSSYIWTDHANFYGNGKFICEYDPMW